MVACVIKTLRNRFDITSHTNQFITIMLFLTKNKLRIELNTITCLLVNVILFIFVECFRLIYCLSIYCKFTFEIYKYIVMKKILLIDDKASIGKVVSIYFSKEYDFIYLENPIKAIEWLQEGNYPDLIISDIRMPEMTGDVFLRYMKKNELYKSIPIVMLSSEDSTTERIKLLEEGAADYILKPFNPLELKVRIKKIID